MTKTEAKPKIIMEAGAKEFDVVGARNHQTEFSAIPARQPGRFFADIAADGTHQGKTTMAMRLKAHLQEAGLRVTTVRIESQHVAARRHEDEILIPVEDIGQSSATIGGIAGVMEPALDAVSRMLKDGGGVIFDWGGGLVSYRCELLAATGLDQVLAQADVPAWSLVVATETEPSMRQALSVLERTADCAPKLQRALVLNSLHNGFRFAETTPSDLALRSLLAHKGLGPTLRIPLVAGQSMAALAPLGLDHRAIMEIESEKAASTLGRSTLLTGALLAHFGVWYEKTAQEFSRILPFRAD